MRDDWFLLTAELRLQRAHAQTLAAAGILTPPELAALTTALDGLEATYGGSSCPDTEAEDLHTWVEAQLTERAGDAGRKIHTARSRNDQVATLLKLYVIAAGAQLADDLGTLITTAARRAQQWAEYAFPLQTHTQFAAPGSVGFWVLRYATAFARVRGHLAALLAQWRQYCPLGAGAVAGSSIPIDRTIQARELGFVAPALNALDATTTRDECVELLAVGTQFALHLQSFATDVVLFSQTPLAWTQYPPAFGTGSSMMPNKLNPDAMELLRGEANAVAAAHSQLVLLLKGLPSGYNRDLQCVKPVVRDATQKLHALAEMTAAFLAELEFDADKLRAALSLGHVNATLRMESLVQSGTPLRDAHHKVAEEVVSSTDGATPVIPNPLSQYQTVGSTSPAEVRRIAAELLQSIA
jgi:argininosuccinate lyase